VTVVVVSGIPGSGKTTLATRLGAESRLPVLSKHVIKESLMDTLGSGDLEWVSRLSRASHAVLYAVVRALPGDVIIEAHFHRGVAEPHLLALGRPLVQIYCRCPVDVAWARYATRRDDPARHPGHRPEHQDEEATRSWRESTPAPLDLDAPLLDVDTSGPVDVDGLAAELRGLVEGK